VANADLHTCNAQLESECGVFCFRAANHLLSSFCSNVVVRNVTILAPYDSPNTDGVDPGTFNPIGVILSTFVLKGPQSLIFHTKDLLLLNLYLLLR